MYTLAFSFANFKIARWSIDKQWDSFVYPTNLVICMQKWTTLAKTKFLSILFKIQVEQASFFLRECIITVKYGHVCDKKKPGN